MRKTCVVVVGLAAVLVAGAALAQAIPNWNAPATWTPAKGMVASAQADIGYPVPFIPITPCRVADTRGNGFTGAYGPPALAASGTRDFTITGQCGIPSGASAVSFNFTVTNGAAAGDLRFYPAGGAVPTVSTINWYAGEPPLANAAVVPLGAGGAISVKNDSTGTVHLIIDVNGYYAGVINSSEYFQIVGNWPGGGVIYGNNTSTSGSGTSGVHGRSNVGGVGAAGVTGDYAGSVGGYGVGGNSVTATNAAGVYGRDQASQAANFASLSKISAGVRGESATYIGVYGLAALIPGAFENYDGSGVLQAFGYVGLLPHGVQGTTLQTSTGAAGVYGQASGTTGVTYGVEGFTNSVDANAVGVKGTAGSPNLGSNSFVYAGVRGEAGDQGWGVVGISNSYGASGYHLNLSTGAIETIGHLAFSSTTAIYGAGNSIVTGTKSFVDPHPTDPTKVIKYVSLEGPEAGTYFRGKGTIIGGQALIEVPESFRMVTDPEGLTVQVTPIGRSVAVSVVSYDLNAIVVEANRDVEFFYMVNGVRRGFKDFQPIQENEEYRPATAKDTMPAALSAEQKRILVQTGIYHEDGTVNMDTAERLGWAQQWRDQEARLKAAAEEAAAKRAAEQVTEKGMQQP